MAGRFPGAENIDEFWHNLKNGIETVSFFSEKELKDTNESAWVLKDPNYVKARGTLEFRNFFDASFFGYAPGEALLMDPQVRILHECSWTALEDAGYDPDTYAGVIGVYAGASSHFNWVALTLWSGQNRDLAGRMLADKDFLSARLAYKLNLKGPAILVQTSCTTSLTAVHMACRALLLGECTMALARGDTQRERRRYCFIKKAQAGNE